MEQEQQAAIDAQLRLALEHVRDARFAIAAAQRELPGQADDDMQHRISALWGETFELQQRIAVFKREVRKGATVNAG